LFLQKEKYDSARIYFDKALPLYQKAERWRDVVTCYNKVSASWFSLSKYDEALQSAQLAIQFSKAKLRSEYSGQSDAYVMIGLVYEFKSNLDSASKNFEKALQLDLKVYGELHQNVARDYRKISNVCFYRGDYQVGLEYNERALKIYQTVYKGDRTEVADVYNSLGIYCFHTNQSEKGIQYLKKAIAIYIKTIGEKTSQVGNCYNNLGLHHSQLNQISLALFYYKSALKIYQEVFHMHPYMLMFYRNIGKAYADENKYSESLKNYDKAIELGHSFFGIKHPALAAVYGDLVEVHAKKGNFISSLKTAQLALIANVAAFNDTSMYSNPPLEKYFDAENLLKSLSNKAKSFLGLYKQKNEIQYLNASINVYGVIEKLIDIMRSSHNNQSDKIHFGKFVDLVAEGAIYTYTMMYEISHDAHYLEKAFYFSEKSKAGTLADAQSELTAKNFGTIPMDLLELEKKLKDERSHFEEQIQQEESNGPISDTINSTAKAGLFSVNRKYDSLVRHFEKKYPQYYDFKYQDKIVSVNDIQKKLDSETALIEYFVGENTVYSFVITNNDFKYLVLGDPGEIEISVNELRKILNPVKNKARSKYSFVRYVKQANALYNKVLNDALSYCSDKKKLLIIPDGNLNYLPFDVLLSKPDSLKNSYKELPYVLNTRQICYGYSASILFNKKRPKINERADGLLAFAPAYGNKYLNSLATVDDGFRSRLTALAWNQQEVKDINKYVEGLVLTGDDASERNFKEKANQYDVIHLAMHALIDDEKPMYSKLAFASTQPGNDDGFLNAYELYNMELQAELVVLSACETGFGKFERGEGIMSMAHAFTYAGCPSIVMSHWVADDKATANLMKLFYKNLSTGLTKDEALQKAKIEFLKDADDVRQNPAFWAGFVLMGDTSSIQMESFLERYRGHFLVLPSLLLLIAVFYFRKKIF